MILRKFERTKKSCGNSDLDVVLLLHFSCSLNVYPENSKVRAHVGLQAQNAHKAGISLRAGHWANWPALRMILPAWIDHLEEFSSYK